jgi:hypothetical protein
MAIAGPQAGLSDREVIEAMVTLIKAAAIQP